MYSPSINPQPFGPVKVQTPGTPVGLNANLIALGLAAAADPILVNKMNIISLPSNTGNIYLGIAGMNKSTLAGVLYVFTAGNMSWQITNNMATDTYQFQRLVIDADVAGEGVYGAIDQV